MADSYSIASYHHIIAIDVSDYKKLVMQGVAQRFKGLKYQSGFGNGFETEAIEGVLPKSKH